MVKRDFQRLPVFLMSFILAFIFCSPVSDAQAGKEKTKNVKQTDQQEKPKDWVDFTAPVNTPTILKPILVKPMLPTSKIHPRERSAATKLVSSALEPIQITKLEKVPEPENTGENKRHKKR